MVLKFEAVHHENEAVIMALAYFCYDIYNSAGLYLVRLKRKYILMYIYKDKAQIIDVLALCVCFFSVN